MPPIFPSSMDALYVLQVNQVARRVNRKPPGLRLFKPILTSRRFY